MSVCMHRFCEPPPPPLPPDLPHPDKALCLRSAPRPTHARAHARSHASPSSAGKKCIEAWLRTQK